MWWEIRRTWIDIFFEFVSIRCISGGVERERVRRLKIWGQSYSRHVNHQHYSKSEILYYLEGLPLGIFSERTKLQ